MRNQLSISSSPEPAARTVRTTGDLLTKYKPWTLSDVRGQPAAKRILQSFLLDVEDTPYSKAFLFSGPTGVGKTSSALALAYDLGCSRNCPDAEMAGIWNIPSGQQDGTAVKQLLDSLRLRPMFGAGWKVAIVNEADAMTRQAEVIWLDALERLPVQTVVVFTTNDTRKMSDRFKTRCEPVSFEGEQLEAALGDFVREVWAKETGRLLVQVPAGIGKLDLASGTLSFRLALQQMAPYIRQDKDMPDNFYPPFMREEEEIENATRSRAAHKAWETRRKTVAS